MNQSSSTCFQDFWKLLYHVIILLLISKGSAIRFFIRTAPFYILSTLPKNSSFPTFLPKLDYLFFFLATPYAMWDIPCEVKWSGSHSVVYDPLWPCGLYSPWNSPGQNPGVGSLSLLQGIFQTQGLNPGLQHCRWILYQPSHKGIKPMCPAVKAQSLNHWTIREVLPTLVILYFVCLITVAIPIGVRFFFSFVFLKFMFRIQKLQKYLPLKSSHIPSLEKI